MLAVDRVESDHLARQVEAEHALAAVAVDDVGLDRAGADRGDRVERVALAEHVVAGMERADVLDEHVQVQRARRLSMPCARHACENAQVEQKCSASPSSAAVRASACGKTGRLTSGPPGGLDRAREFHRDAGPVEIAIEAHRDITQ